MKSKSSKITLFVISIVIIIIVIIVGVILMLNNKKSNSTYIEEPKTEEKDKDIEVKKQLNIDESEYYDIAKLVRGYYGLLNKSNYMTRAGESFAEEQSVKESIYNVISKEYIERENITVENIYDYVPDINETVTFVPDEMEVSEGMGIDKYLVSGTLIYTLDTEKYSEIKLFVNVDHKNKTFSIEPMSEQEQAQEKIEIDNSEEEIAKKNNNNFEPSIMNEQELAKEKFNNLKLLMLRKSEKLYNMFDEEYKNKKFGNYQGYVQYVEDNYERLTTMYLTKYKVDELDSYTQYVCIDNYGRYCIFRNKTATEVEILLDTYTVDLPEFTEKYNKASAQEKVGMNIEKFINAINEQDYKYGYDRLDEVFKRNNMPTQQDFENYVKNNMYENNVLEHNEVKKEGNIFVYELGIKDGNNEDAEQKKLTVIMQLKEGTDFVMSFSME